jgi:hypothetical protein
MVNCSEIFERSAVQRSEIHFMAGRSYLVSAFEVTVLVYAVRRE